MPLRRRGEQTGPPPYRQSGSPPESSAIMFQRPSAAATRRARARSGVMRAAVAAGVSIASRKTTAIASASSSALAASITAMFAMPVEISRSSPRRSRSRQRCVAAAGRMISDTSASRPCAGASAVTSSRRTPRRASNACMANCGCPIAGAASAAPPIMVQASSSRCVSSPGSTTAPCGRRAMVASKAAVAGIEPVDPAAITGWSGEA